MSSRSGPRAAGTDGTDFSHREIIKEQYYVSNGFARGHPRETLVINNDPGVQDDEYEEEYDARFTKYQDQEEFLEDLQQQEVMAAANDTASPREDLPLTGDYQGMGGPNTVPMEAPGGAFEVPARPSSRTALRACILDELFLSPTDEQIKAFQKIQTKKENAQNKSRLKWSIFSHLVVFLAMMAKLTPDMLDKLDIFVLELEELKIPKPLYWEWIWSASICFTFFGLSACKRSNVAAMTKFFYGIILFGMLPVLFGFAYYAGDVFTYATTKSKTDLDVWKGYPISVLWFVFLAFAFQAHIFELYFARILVGAWQPKRKAQ